MPKRYDHVALLTEADFAEREGASYETGSTSRLAGVIDEVSAEFASYIQQHTLRAEREEKYVLRGSQRVLTLRGRDIDEDDFSLEIDGQDLDEDDFTLDAEHGWLKLNAPTTGRREDSVTAVVRYTAGLGADAAEVKANYRDLHRAAAMQVQYRMERGDSLGGALTIPQGHTQSSDGQYGFLRHVKTVLDRYVRWTL